MAVTKLKEKRKQEEWFRIIADSYIYLENRQRSGEVKALISDNYLETAFQKECFVFMDKNNILYDSSYPPSRLVRIYIDELRLEYTVKTIVEYAGYLLDLDPFKQSSEQGRLMVQFLYNVKDEEITFCYIIQSNGQEHSEQIISKIYEYINELERDMETEGVPSGNRVYYLNSVSS